jgi:uncharacterized protein (TIGR00369 family)
MAMPFLTHIPFVEHLGLELLRLDPGEAELQLVLRPELTNSWEVAHGGVVMTLLDVALAHGARSPEAAGGEPQPGVVTVEMKTSFLRPGLGTLRAVGRRLHRSASLAFCEGSVFDAQGQLLAHATGTFKYMRALPAGGRKIQRLGASD